MKKITTLLALLSFSQMPLQAATTIQSFFGDPIFLLGPVAQSLGGAAYSLNLPHDSLLLNPASGAFSQQYAVDATFSTAVRTLSASVFDSKSTDYGAGLSYLRRNVENDDTQHPLLGGTSQQTYQAFSLGIFGKLHETFSIGVNVRYSIRNETGLADADGKSWNGDVGAEFKPTPKLGVGVVYKNLLGDTKNLEMRVLAGGAHFEIIPSFLATASIEKYSATSGDPKFTVPDDSKFAWAVGGQYTVIGKGVSVRAGFRDSAPWKTQFFLAGLGYNDATFHVAYGLALVTKGEKLTTHTFGLGLDF